MRKIKSVGVSLAEEIKDLYNENYENLMKEIIKVTEKCKDFPGSTTGRIDIIKMSIWSKAICSFTTIPAKTGMTFFTEVDKAIIKIIWNHKDSE